MPQPVAALVEAINQPDRDDTALAGTIPEWIRDGRWMTHALCKTSAGDGITWFTQPQKPGAAARAIAVCNRCPVQTECLLYALAHGCRRAGIWGGMSDKKRDRLRHYLATIGLALPVRTCRWCHQKFTVARLDNVAKFCSPEHRLAARRMRRHQTDRAR